MNGLDPEMAQTRRPQTGLLHLVRAQIRVDRAPLFLLTALLCLLYATPLRFLFVQAWQRTDSSHALLIPFISLYLVWEKRDLLRTLSPQPALGWGLAAMAAASGLFIVGRAGAMVVLEQTSILPMLVGLILALRGWKYLMALWLPVAYLVLMLPLIDEIMQPLKWPLQLMTAKMSVAFLQLSGFPVLLTQQYITLPNIVLEVADVCSGANFLISIVAIGIPLAALRLSRPAHRGLLVLSAIVVGVVANWLRVILISMGAYYGYPVLHGPSHVFQGVFVAQIGFLYLFFACWMLSKREYAVAGSPGGSDGAISSTPTQPESVPPVSLRPAVCAVAILIVLIGYTALLNRGEVPLRHDFDSIPRSVGAWVGPEVDPALSPFRMTGADRELFRIYRDPTGGSMALYVAYFSSQAQGRELVAHQTAALHANAIELKIAPPLDTADTHRPDGAVLINATDVGKGDSAVRGLFWYDVGGQIIADPYRARWVSLREKLLHGENPGALFLIVPEPDRLKDPAQVGVQMEDFARRLLSENPPLYLTAP